MNNMWDKILDEESGASLQNKEMLETTWEAPAGYMEEPQTSQVAQKKMKRRTTYHPNKKVLWEKILDEESGRTTIRIQ